MSARASFAIVLRTYRDTRGKCSWYWSESSPGLSIEAVAGLILKGEVDDAQAVLLVNPNKGTAVDVTSDVAELVATEAQRQCDAGDDPLPDVVDFAEAFTKWRRPRERTVRSYELQHRLTARDAL